MTTIQESKRNRKPLSKAEQVAIFRRDGWLCWWCKKPVIFAPVMKLLEMQLRSKGDGKRFAYYHAHWTRYGAPLLDELGAVLDHVQAFSTGGECKDGNLVASCAKCNGRKSAAAVERWEQREKRSPIKGKYGEPQHWDGLTSVFVMLADSNLEKLTAGEKAWLKVLRSGDG